MARGAVKDLEFKDCKLSEADKAWASEEFRGGWSKYKDLKDYWWVRDRYIVLVGVVGDRAALPVLRDIISDNSKQDCVYAAINAVTRLTGKDVRDKPVEAMDINKTRPKVLELLKDNK